MYRVDKRERANENTLSQMTNPFRTKQFQNMNQSNAQTMLSQSEINRTNLGHPYNEQMRAYGENDEFSSPEMGDASQYYADNRNQVQSQTDCDPSSSSMSGYDLRGMLNKVQN